MEIGSLRGFAIELHKTPVTGEINACLCGESKHFVEFGISAPHNLRKIEKVLTTVNERLDNTRESLYELDKNYKSACTILEKPFSRESELKSKTERHQQLTDELNTEKQNRQTAEKAKKNGNDKPEIDYFKKRGEAFKSACAAMNTRENSQAQQQDNRGNRGNIAVEEPEPGFDDD
jgi:flagellar biosynthesis/type III secretory pathway chaperone